MHNYFLERHFELLTADIVMFWVEAGMKMNHYDDAPLDGNYLNEPIFLYSETFVVLYYQVRDDLK